MAVLLEAQSHGGSVPRISMVNGACHTDHGTRPMIGLLMCDIQERKP